MMEPAVRHGVAGIDNEIEDRKLQLVGVGADRGQLQREAHFQFGAAAQRSLEQVRHSGDERRYVDGLEDEFLPAREGQHALRQRHRAWRP